MDTSSIGGLISAIDNAKNNSINNIFNAINLGLAVRNSNLNKKAFEFQKDYTLNQAQYTVADYTKAGLNPILASSSPSPSFVSSTPNSQASVNPLGSSFDTLVTSLMQKEMNKESNTTSSKNVDKQVDSQEKQNSNNNLTALKKAQLEQATQLQIAREKIASDERLSEERIRGEKWRNDWNAEYDFYDGAPNNPYTFGIWVSKQKTKELERTAREKIERSIQENKDKTSALKVHKMAVEAYNKNVDRIVQNNYASFVRECSRSGLTPPTIEQYKDWNRSLYRK